MPGPSVRPAPPIAPPHPLRCLFQLGSALVMVAMAGACAGHDEAEPDPFAGVPRAELVEVYRLGGIDAPEETSFEGEPGIVASADGTTFVRHARRGRVAVFDSAGRFQRWIGGSGEGPGEFQIAIAHGLVGDTLWIRNVPAPRISRFLVDGTHVSTHHTPFDFGVPLSSPGGVSGFLRGGRAWAVADGFVVGEEGQVALPFLVGDATLARADTLFRIPNPRGRLAGQAFAPFVQPPWFDVAPDGSRIVVAHWSDQAPAELGLRGFSTEGSIVLDRTLTVPARSVPSTVRDSVLAAGIEAVESLAERLREQGIPEGSFRATISAREVAEEVYLPSHHPPIRRVVAGIDGTHWLELTDGMAPGDWLALDAEGEPLFRLRLPDGARLRAASRASIWTTELDELDVPRLVRWRLEWGG